MNIFEIAATGTTAGDAATYTRGSADSVLRISNTVAGSRGIIFPANSAIGDEIITFYVGDENHYSVRIYPSDGAVMNNSSGNPSATFIVVGDGSVARFRMISATQWLSFTS